MDFRKSSIENLRSLGYTQDEARFLYLVAMHSGYFSARQYLTFTGAKSGERSLAFTQKVLGKGHATARMLLRNGRVYHLFSRLVYRAMGREHLRNRREHSVEHMRTKLAILDFVLGHLDYRYLETEDDKVAYFCRDLGIARFVLPAKHYAGAIPERTTARHFVDKFPMFFSPESSSPRVVTFSFVDSGSSSIANLGVHLAAYQGLFRHLSAFRFVYVAPRTAAFRRAEERFRSIVKEPLETDVSTDILRYFAIRRKWERHEYVVPITEELEFLSDARRRFHEQHFEDLYRSWISGGVAEHALRAELAQVTPGKKVSFETYLIRNRQTPVDEKHKRHVSDA